MKKFLALLIALMCAFPFALAKEADPLCVPGEAFTPVSQLHVDMHLEDFSAFVAEDSSLRFRGTMQANEPLLRVEAKCYDLRTLELFGEYTWTAPEGEEDVYSLDLYPMRRALFPQRRASEYRVVITAHSAYGSCTAFDQRIFIAGELVAPANMNADCVFDCAEDRIWVWSDGRDWSGWGNEEGEESMTVTLPQGRAAEGISINWQIMPSYARIASFDSSGSLCSEILIDDTTFTPLHAWYPLPEKAASFTVSIPENDGFISELLVVEQEKRADSVQIWRETADKWDLMLVSTHQDDEHLFFGGMIPHTVAQGKEIGLVYMVNCGRERYSEALNGLWAAGMDNYPVFIGMRDGIIDSKSAAYKYWGGEDPVVQALVEQIRRYKPEVVLTHDFEGEYDNNQHKVVAECTAKAVELAADPAYHPASAQEYGVWQAKKLYIHLYEENEINFDWDQSIEGFGSLTGYDISRIAYSFHRSQQRWVRYSLGLSHDPYRFGLYYTAVGPDTRNGDLFQNIAP